VSRVIAVFFLYHGTRKCFEVTPRPLFTAWKDTIPIVQEAEWAAGSVWTPEYLVPHRDSISDCPARSQLLYRLSYLGPQMYIDGHVNVNNPITFRERPGKFQEFEALRFQDIRHMKMVRLLALHTGHLYPQEIFLVLISVRF